jgi:hypothetical protein
LKCILNRLETFPQEPHPAKQLTYPQLILNRTQLTAVAAAHGAANFISIKPNCHAIPRNILRIYKARGVYRSDQKESFARFPRSQLLDMRNIL